MPSLDPAHKALLGPVAGMTCQGCDEDQVRHYCRQCDQFFFTCKCKQDNEHQDHRVYLWTTEGVVSRPPDFADLIRRHDFLAHALRENFDETS